MCDVGCWEWKMLLSTLDRRQPQISFPLDAFRIEAVQRQILLESAASASLPETPAYLPCCFKNGPLSSAASFSPEASTDPHSNGATVTQFVRVVVLCACTVVVERVCTIIGRTSTCGFESCTRAKSWLYHRQFRFHSTKSSFKPSERSEACNGFLMMWACHFTTQNWSITWDKSYAQKQWVLQSRGKFVWGLVLSRVIVPSLCIIIGTP